MGSFEHMFHDRVTSIRGAADRGRFDHHAQEAGSTGDNC
jgi:hypothetical protein